MTIRRVTGTEFDGTTVTTTFGRHEIPALKAEYDDKVETGTTPNMGTQRQGPRTPGIYKTEQVKITFLATVFRAMLMPLFPKNGGSNVKTSIVVGFTHPDIGSDSDLLAGARCVGWKASAENSNKPQEVETTWDIDQIYWTSARKTKNVLAGPIASTSGNF